MYNMAGFESVLSNTNMPDFSQYNKVVYNDTSGLAGGSAIDQLKNFKTAGTVAKFGSGLGGGLKGFNGKIS